jgi:hypothetical protein
VISKRATCNFKELNSFLVTIRSLFNYFLLAHLLQVTGIVGEFGETMALSEAIPAGMDSQTWLKALEKSMKTTLMMNFTKCLINTWSRTEDDTVVSDFVEKGEWLQIMKVAFYTYMF